MSKQKRRKPSGSSLSFPSSSSPESPSSSEDDGRVGEAPRPHRASEPIPELDEVVHGLVEFHQELQRLGPADDYDQLQVKKWARARWMGVLARTIETLKELRDGKSREAA